MVFLSALDESLDKVEAFRAGGVAYITKPFQIDEVLIRVENRLAVRRLQKNLESANKELQEINVNLEERIERRAAELTRLQNAQERFVPRQLLDGGDG